MSLGSHAQELKCPNGLTLNLKLTGTWYLEYTGADFAKKFAAQASVGRIAAGILDGSPGPRMSSDTTCFNNIRTSIEVLDELRKNVHGVLVGNMLSGDFGAANIENLHSIVASGWRKDSDVSSELIEAAKSGMRVLNMSYITADDSWGGFSFNKTHRNDFQTLTKLAQQGVIIVAASGNDGDERKSLYSFTKNLPGIVVGGMDPRGKMPSFSQYDEKVLVLAPGQNIIAKDEMGQLSVKSGTSFAAPIVSGSIVNTLQIAPELTRNNIELLLRKTGVDLNLAKGQGQDIKMINSYKMVRVAERLQKALQTKKSLSPDEKEKFISGFISDPKNLDFESEAKMLMNEGQRNEDSGDCSLVWKSIGKYRESFLLSNSKEAATHLVYLYKKIGLTVNSQFFERFTQ